ncbi:hypothetical protein [Thermostaphylospora chromogena]|uniref:DUF885 domain-containing protein n=1 Tax=Thermostaphylospora chromogena TaxID=35622 RepID=A0A1H1EJ07_9ACTN|nr:hypothetical protein [Thermostaphylospora chromogena]SDQ88732.1 hypothetical protein SAMN04489764_2503 [Thermostaphylospora chromogena]
MVEQEWQRAYAMLSLRLNRLLGGHALVYLGPEEWKREADAEPPPPPGLLAEDAEALLEHAPTPYATAHVRAMRAVARYLNGDRPPLAEYGRQTLGLKPEWVPESVFEEAHAWLDAALPKSSGSLADRLHAWQAAHTLDRIELLPDLVAKAVAETRARTGAIVPLPPGEEVGCELVPQAHYHAAGAHHGGLRSTIYINTGIPFNLADLLYVVAHEGHPGHIAESLLKEIHVPRPDQRVRLLMSPSFVLGEGLGLSAEEIIFPGDEAQAWLTDNVLSELGIRPDGSDFAAIHRAKNVLWGVWGNVAFMAAEGRPDEELAAYLSRWSLYDETEIAQVLPSLKPSPMSPYIFGYFHGWRLLRPWVGEPGLVRRLLTEQLLPADVDG